MLSDYGFIFVVSGICCGLLFAHWVPGFIKRRHIGKQNRLIELCRARYLLALDALAIGNKELARELLSRIRRLESLWRLGASIPYRMALASFAVLIGYLGNTVFRGVTLFPTFGHTTWTAEGIVADIALFAVLGATGALYALTTYLSSWHSP